MKKKLNDEEYKAFLQMFDGQTVQFRKLSSQTRAFRLSFYFINAYCLIFISVFFMMSRVFESAINSDIFTTGYVSVLNARVHLSLWLLAGVNISFYFGFYFRFFLILILMYLLNSTIDQTLMFFLQYDFNQMPLLFTFFFTRPLLILALLVAFFKYNDHL